MQGAKGSLKIAQLPAGMRLDTPWPTQSIPLDATPLRIIAIPEHGLYAMTVTKQVRAFLQVHALSTSEESLCPISPVYLALILTMNACAPLHFWLAVNRSGNS